ncbi:golgin subfamily A member 6-like protein 25 [Ostrea edulis]|uniref:golgin subfamily A member 6-like protein 25 n=1 Tax=Ostrea edulis TaxID=37623 RepID=UPI0024AFE57C|nr:golgin subfamily A member 6-like protein 25 [Ostrea edulis]
MDQNDQKISDLLSVQENLIRQKSDITIKLEKVQRELCELQREVKVQNSENVELRNSIEEKENRLLQHKVESNEYESRIVKLQQELEIQRSSHKLLTEKPLSSAEDRNTDFEKLNSEIKKLQKLCKAKDAKISKMTQEMNNQDLGDRKDFENKVEKLETTLKEVIDERESMRIENQKLQKMYKGREVKLKKLDEIVTEQEKLLSQYEADKLILSESVNELNEKVEDARYEEQIAQKELQKFTIQRQERIDEIEELRKFIAKKEEEIIKFDGELVHLKDLLQQQNTEFNKRNQSQHVFSSQLEEENTALKSKVEKMDEEIQILKSKIVSLEESHEKHVTESKKLNMVTKGKDTKVKKMEEVLKKKEEELKSVHYQLQEIKKSYESSLEKEEVNAQEILKLQKLGKGKEAKAKKFEDVINMQEKLLADKVTDVVILQGSISEMNLKLEDLGATEQSLRSDLEDHLKTITELKVKCSKLEQNELDLRHALEMKEEIQKLNRELETSKESYNLLLQEKEEVEEQCRKIKHSLLQTEEKLHESENEVQRLSEDLEKVRKEKENIIYETEKMKKVGKGKLTKLGKFQEIVEKQESIISEKDTDLLMMKERINDLSEKLGQKEEELQLLQGDLERMTRWEEVCKQHERTIHDIHQSVEDRTREFTEGNIESDRKISILEEKCSALENTIEFLQRQEKDMELEIQSLSASSSEADYWKNRCQKLEEGNESHLKRIPIVSDLIERQETNPSLAIKPKIQEDSTEDNDPEYEDLNPKQLITTLDKKQALILSMQDNHQKELAALNAKLSKMKTLCKAKDAKIAKLQNMEKDEQNRGDESGSSNARESTDNLSLNSSVVDNEWRERIMHSEVVMQLERQIEDLKDVIQSRDEEIVDGRDFAINQQEELHSLREFLNAKEEDMFGLKERVYGWEDWYDKEFRGIESSLAAMEKSSIEKDTIIANMKEELDSLKDISMTEEPKLLEGKETDV